MQALGAEKDLDLLLKDDTLGRDFQDTTLVRRSSRTKQAAGLPPERRTSSSPQNSILQEQFKTLTGEVLASTGNDDWLVIEYVLQRHRDVWVLVETWPYLAIDRARVETYCAGLVRFAVFSCGRLF